MRYYTLNTWEPVQVQKSTLVHLKQIKMTSLQRKIQMREKRGEKQTMAAIGRVMTYPPLYSTDP